MDEPGSWYHCIAGTYGSWLYGDERGFRTRHHRQHVDGDYRHPPPPGQYAHVQRASRASMRGEAVVLGPQERLVVCRTLARALLDYGVELAEISVGGQHVHLAGCFPAELIHSPLNLLTDGRAPVPRHLLGRAKRSAAMALGKTGSRPAGGHLWAKRSKIEPIRDTAHQRAVVQYIRRHKQKGAVLWSELQENETPGEVL